MKNATRANGWHFFSAPEIPGGLLGIQAIGLSLASSAFVQSLKWALCSLAAILTLWMVYAVIERNKREAARELEQQAHQRAMRSAVDSAPHLVRHYATRLHDDLLTFHDEIEDNPIGDEWARTKSRYWYGFKPRIEAIIDDFSVHSISDAELAAIWRFPLRDPATLKVIASKLEMMIRQLP